MAGASAAVFGSADRYLAQLDSVLGAPSADSTSSVPSRWTGGWVRSPTRWRRSPRGAGIGPATRRTDGVTLSQSLAEEARALARRIGHRRVLRDLDAEPAPHPERAPLPNGLTEREVDVLRLVAEGLSNREIGERLFISANTSANHVRSILIKTAAPNRTKAAVFATEHGLLR